MYPYNLRNYFLAYFYMYFYFYNMVTTFIVSRGVCAITSVLYVMTFDQLNSWPMRWKVDVKDWPYGHINSKVNTRMESLQRCTSRKVNVNILKQEKQFGENDICWSVAYYGGLSIDVNVYLSHIMVAWAMMSMSIKWKCLVWERFMNEPELHLGYLCRHVLEDRWVVYPLCSI